MKKNTERKQKLILVVLVLFLATLACDEDVATSTPVSVSSEEVDALIENLPEERNLLLGLQPFAHTFTDKALNEAYEFAAEHSDLLFYHMDEGIPWYEALNGEPYHENLLKEIEDMADKRPVDKKLFLAITPTSTQRNEIALYRGKEVQMPLSAEWQGRSFNHPEVIAAYTNHARYMIDTLKPDYLAYGIEVNCSTKTSNDKELKEFLDFAAEVYPTLKSEYPDLPIFLTICTGSFEHDNIQTLFDSGKKVLAYSDYVAISTYPYWVVPGMDISEADPGNLPKNWLSEWAGLAPEKPFVIAETAYPAEDLVMTPVPGWDVKITSNEFWQAQYVSLMLDELNTLNAEFVAWFIPRDYDELYDFMEKHLGDVEVLKAWRDTGFLDGKGNERLVLNVWDAWLDISYADK